MRATRLRSGVGADSQAIGLGADRHASGALATGAIVLAAVILAATAGPLATGGNTVVFARGTIVVTAPVVDCATIAAGSSATAARSAGNNLNPTCRGAHITLVN